ncbi:MAG: hypothetical protein L0154_25695 [Chloroflexi bacterium]|nr:hypothetical protein [Chloroflexota bacterium]
MDFKWIPGQGINQDAIAWMKQNFKKPVAHPQYFEYEDSRDSFLTMADNDPKDWDLGLADYFLRSANAFEWHDDWQKWVLFLLVGLISNPTDYELICHTTNFFLQAQRLFSTEPYIGFREDLLYTLGTVMMAPIHWEGDDLSDEWFKFDSLEGIYRSDFPDLLHSQLFFVLSYLDESEIPGWVASLNDITCKYWLKELNQWLGKFQIFLVYTRDHEALSHQIRSSPSITFPRSLREQPFTIGLCLEQAEIAWNGSYFRGESLDDYIPPENITAFLEAVKAQPNLAYDEDLAG